MYKVVIRYHAPDRPFHGKIRKTRLYQSESTFQRYGTRYVGFTWTSFFFGVAYKLSELHPNSWEAISDPFPGE